MIFDEGQFTRDGKTNAIINNDYSDYHKILELRKKAKVQKNLEDRITILEDQVNFLLKMKEDQG